MTREIDRVREMFDKHTHREELIKALADELGMWRYLLWMHHGHQSIIYGDDGEMQCAACMLDFKRNPVAHIADRWERMAVERSSLPAMQAAMANRHKPRCPCCQGGLVPCTHCDGEGYAPDPSPAPTTEAPK